ncbi:hypothetical protein JTE90_010956 [Oedothorax gibbosus]|uniref:Cilia-and flagella-associated protein 96 n=1 Tax=Oedothorax gibbosus TaxID=931172 RepID=A0AAV6UAC3_9ARAC|nr:hypothetical protein JTE90_010956 [Oedothorax gibbosus]
MGETAKKEEPDFERIGLFKEMSYLEEHVPVKIDFNTSSKKGKQMRTHCSRIVNGTQDGYFDKSFARAFEGEAYADPVRTRRLHRLQEAKKNLTKDFKYTSPLEKSCGLGNSYGTFGTDDGKPIQHFSGQTEERKKDPTPKKNFLVNPPKKGTGYGYPNVTIGKDLPYSLGTKYEDLKNTSKTRVAPKTREFKPYRAGAFQKGFFDPNPYFTEHKQEDEEEEEETAKDEGDTRKIFRPTGPAKKDGGMKDGCLSKFPKYMGDPYTKDDPISRGVKQSVNDKNKIFRPVPGPKPYPIKSIITKNVQRKVTPINFTTTKGVVYCNNS